MFEPPEISLFAPQREFSNFLNLEWNKTTSKGPVDNQLTKHKKYPITRQLAWYRDSLLNEDENEDEPSVTVTTMPYCTTFIKRKRNI